MIASGYALHLYCDADNCRRGEYDRYAKKMEFHTETGAAAREHARSVGWKINLRHGLAICPDCAKEGRKPTPNGIIQTRKAGRHE